MSPNTAGAAGRVPRERAVLALLLCFGAYVAVYILRLGAADGAADKEVTGSLKMITPAELAAQTKGDRTSMPRLLHQSYRSRDRLKTSQVEWMRSFETRVGAAGGAGSDGWQHVFWSDEDNDALIKRELPWLYGTYRAYPHAIQRADIARIAVILTYGGVYADADYACVRDGCLDDVYTSRCHVLLQDSPYPDVDGLFQNSLMASDGSAAAADFWQRTLRLADRFSNTNTTSAWLGLVGSGGVLLSTGPGLLTYSYGEMIGVDAAEAKGVMHNFDGDKVKALFPPVPREDGEGVVCKLPAAVYSGQKTGITTTSKTYHHNAKSWVDSVHSKSFYIPRLLVTLPWVVVPPFYFTPQVFYAAVSVAYLLLQRFPGSVIEAILAVGLLGGAVFVRRRSGCMPGAAVVARHQTFCIGLFLFAVAATHWKFFAAH